MDTATAHDECPFLHPGRPLGHDVRVGIYCRVLDGRVRVPPVEEQRLYCLTGRWPDCPVHRDHAAAS